MSFPLIADALNAALGTRWNFPIPTFGCFVAIAVLAATTSATRVCREFENQGKLPLGANAVVSDMAIISTIVGIAGARVFDILDNLNRFEADPVSLLLTRSGFSIYGGLCFGILAGVIYVRRLSIPVIPMLDAAAPAMMLGYAIGRLGCQVSGDGDWGIAANMASKPSWLPDWLWAQTYDGNIAGVIIAPPGVYPTPVYEFAMALGIFAVLWLIRSHHNRAGFLFSAYLMAVGFERLLIEKIRINSRYEVLGVMVTQAEFISLLLILAGLTGLLITLRTNRLWAKVLVSGGVLAALSACAPH